MAPSAKASRWLALSAIVALFLTGVASPALAAGWIAKCRPSHSLMDDPIVFPGQPGVSHLHDFFGNDSTDAFSTYASSVVATSTCGGGDTAGYWVPALYQNDQKIALYEIKAYYRKSNLATGTILETIPADLRVIAGNSHATSEAENRKLGKELYWGCSNNSTEKLKAPPATCLTGRISVHIGFPNCWNGVLTGVNDTLNLAYPKDGICPAGFDRPLPRVIVRLEYATPGTSAGPITLASGPYYTLHGDFWNTWQQATLDQLVTSCLNATVDCGTFK